MRRPITLAALAAASCLLLGACTGGTEPGQVPVDLLGTWRYAGEQLASSPASLTGVLEITSQSGDRLEGSFDLLEASELETRRLTGLMNGVALDAATVDFDVFVDGSVRRHVGAVRADTIEGAWADLQSGGGSGSFRAVRQEAP